MFHWANAVAFHLFGANISAHLGGTAAHQVALAGMAAYGWARWSAVRKNEHDITIRWASRLERALLIAGMGLGTAAFALVLKHYNASWAPWPDADIAFNNGLPVSGLVYVFYFAIVIAGLRQWMVKARAARTGVPSSRPAALREVTI